VPVATALAAERRPRDDDETDETGAASASAAPSDPLAARFALLLRDFAPEDGWAQRNLLGRAEAAAALDALARMHAYEGLL